MAKKAISKHSRAARRALADEPEAKELSKLPKVSNKSEIANFIVRTTNKNEQLLNEKVEKDKARKENRKAKSKIIAGGIGKPDKYKKALAFGGRLSTKIEKSIGRSLIVKKRRNNWDKINDEIKQSLVTANETQKTESATGVDDSASDISSDEKSNDNKETKNAFELLGEIEA